MCSCFRSRSPSGTYKEKLKQPCREEERTAVSLSSLSTARVKDVTVRVVHAGGRIDMYDYAISASKLMKRYPGMCVALPNVFKHPTESLLAPDDLLLPGHKYYVIRSSTVQKLIRRKGRSIKGLAGSGDHHMASTDVVHMDMIRDSDVGDEMSVGSAREYFFGKNEHGGVAVKKNVRRVKFVPPIQKPKAWKEPEWEPSLNSIQEVSP